MQHFFVYKLIIKKMDNFHVSKLVKNETQLKHLFIFEVA
jgi:hypothetical protein